MLRARLVKIIIRQHIAFGFRDFFIGSSFFAFPSALGNEGKNSATLADHRYIKFACSTRGDPPNNCPPMPAKITPIKTADLNALKNKTGP